MTLKISDFGLSRDADDEEQNKSEDTSVEFPVRWMSPESLTYFIFTTKSDVVNIFACLWMCQSIKPSLQTS